MTGKLIIDVYDRVHRLIETRVLQVANRDAASARLFRTLNSPEYGSSFRNRVMARFGDGESDFKVIDVNTITHFRYEESE